MEGTFIRFPFKAPRLADRTSAIAHQPRMKRWSAKLAVGASAWRGVDRPAQPGRAGAQRIETQENAAAVVFLRRQQQTACRGEAEGFGRRRNHAQHARARYSECLLGRPQRVSLRSRMRQQQAIKAKTKVRESLGVERSGFREPVIRARPKDQSG